MSVGVERQVFRERLCPIGKTRAISFRGGLALLIPAVALMVSSRAQAQRSPDAGVPADAATAETMPPTGQLPSGTKLKGGGCSFGSSSGVGGVEWSWLLGAVASTVLVRRRTGLGRQE